MKIKKNVSKTISGDNVQSVIPATSVTIISPFTPISPATPVAVGDSIQAAIAKLQGDINSGGSGSGSVTNVSVTSINGFAGTVTNPTTTPAIRLSTTVNGILNGDGTSISAAIASNFPTLNQNTTGTAANVTGVVDILNGGTGATTANAGLNALLPTQTSNSGKVLQTDGTNTSWVAAGAGAVASVSVVSANGLAGTVANPTTTPAITLSTTVTGVIKGNGTTLSAATSGTDYSLGTSALATGILKSTTTTGALTIATAGDFPTLNQNTTGSAGSVSGTNVITNSNLAQAGANTWKGNNTSSTANETDNSTAGLTESTSSVLTISGGSNALLNATTIQVKQASTSQSGYLSSTDWNTFNNKPSSTLPSGNILVGNASNVSTAVAMSGDASLSNTGSLTIASNAVTNAKLNTMATLTLKGNNTVSTANPLDLTTGQVKSMLALTFSDLSGTASIAQGGTGQTTQAAAITALTGTQTSGTYLRSNGTNASLSTIQAADVPTLNQNTTGNAATATLATTATNIANGAANQLLLQSAANTTGFLATANSSVLVTSGAGVPSWSTTLPALSGASLTSLNGSNISSGTVAAARLPTATNLALGLVQPDGTNITVTAGAINTVQNIQTTSSVRFGSFGVGTAASGTTGEIRATNNVTAFYSSDERLKENVLPIQNALDKVSQIKGVTYDWTEEYINAHGGEDGYFIRKHDVGVIAQDIEKVLPELVADRADGYKAVKYERICALLIEAIKELSQEINLLKKGG